MRNDLEHLVGQRVRQAREAANIDKTTFCLMVGISRPYLNQIENGTANITLRVLQQLAISLEVKVSDLVREDNPCSHQ